MTVHVAGNGYEGYLVADTIVADTSAGGVRICEDLTLEEIGDLAREMSLKFALFQLPRGGAKSGMKMAPELGPSERLQALRDFGHRLGPLLRTGIYSPGMDMNCGPEELRAIYRGAGIELGRVTDTSWFTALTAFHALDACIEDLEIPRPASLAIEGFGSVAQHLAERLSSDYRIVAVATIAGAVVREEGFEPARLAAMRREHGDAFVTHLGGDRVPNAAVLGAHADVLIPAARTRTLTIDAANGVRARAIVPIANAPYVDGVVAQLHDRGIGCLPGYVVNVGGVLASSLFDQGIGRDEIERLFASHYRPFVRDLLHMARRRGVSASELALELATKALSRREPVRHRTLAVRIYERFLRRRLPAGIRATMARGRFVRTFAELRAAVLASEHTA